MNKRANAIVIVALVALLLTLSVWKVGAAPADLNEQAQTQSTSAEAIFAVQPGTSSGGGYQLSSFGPEKAAPGTAEGGNYRLGLTAALTGGGTPCCCTFLPCLIR